MLATSLLSQRQQASGPVPAAASPLFIDQQVEEAVQLQVAFDPHTCLGDGCLHLRAQPACIYVEESALKGW